MPAIAVHTEAKRRECFFKIVRNVLRAVTITGDGRAEPVAGALFCFVAQFLKLVDFRFDDTHGSFS
jgi:hypothetical protein